MENYLGDFSQSEIDKYFEWTRNRYIMNNISWLHYFNYVALGLTFFLTAWPKLSFQWAKIRTSTSFYHRIWLTSLAKGILLLEAKFFPWSFALFKFVLGKNLSEIHFPSQTDMVIVSVVMMVDQVLAIYKHVLFPKKVSHKSVHLPLLAI